MFFWEIEGLKKEIAAGKLTEKDRFIYFFIFIVLTAISGLTAFFPIENPNFWDITNSGLSIIIFIVGTFAAYKANGGSEGTDFLGKYFSISFVMTIRFVVILIPMVIAISIFYFLTYDMDQEIPSTAADTIPFMVWLAALYWRMCKHISDIKAPNNLLDCRHGI